MTGGFTILDHPADMGIEARGQTLAEAFEHAAVGLVSIILDLSKVEAGQSRELEVTGSDREHLLVRWLSEILYLYDGEQFVGKEFDITALENTRLRATVRGEPLTLQKHRTILDVKAVTYHQLEVRETETGVLVRVYLDI